MLFTLSGVQGPAPFLTGIEGLPRLGLVRASRFQKWRLVGGPIGMAGEEATNESYAVAHEETKTQTEQAGCVHQASMEPRELLTGKGKWQSQSRSDQHHSCNRAESKNQQIENGPFWIADGG